MSLKAWLFSDYLKNLSTKDAQTKKVAKNVI